MASTAPGTLAPLPDLGPFAALAPSLAQAFVGLDRFGESAPGEQVAEAMGLSVAAVVDAARRLPRVGRVGFHPGLQPVGLVGAAQQPRAQPGVLRHQVGLQTTHQRVRCFCVARSKPVVDEQLAHQAGRAASRGTV